MTDWLRMTALLCVFASAASPATAANFAIIDLREAPGNKALLMAGQIESSDFATFHAMAERLPGRVVVVMGPGGKVAAALNIGTEIRQRGWDTLVPPGASCASACSLIWLAGSHRLMGKAARLGFHALSVVRDGVHVETHQNDERLRRWLAGLGYSVDVTRMIVGTPADRISWRQPNELLALGIAIYSYPR